MLDWIVTNWWFSIPLGAVIVYAVCATVESSVYKRLGIQGKSAPAKGDFPKSVTILEALAVFAFLLWYNCGAIFWRRGWRPFLLVAFGLFLILLAAALVRAFQRLTRSRRKGGRGYPGPAALGFCVRRTVGSFIPGWFVGFWPAAVFQSIGLEGVDGTARLLVSGLMPALLPLLFLAGDLAAQRTAPSHHRWNLRPAPSRGRKEGKELRRPDVRGPDDGSYRAGHPGGRRGKRAPVPGVLGG